MKQFLTITGISAATIALEPSAIELRDKLASEAIKITTITDAIDADAATAVLREITTQIKACEDSRITIGAPVLEITKKINGTAREFSVLLEAEKARLSRVLGAYQQAERDKAEKARREAADAARRVADEERKKIAAAEIENGADSKEAQAAQDNAADKVAEARVAMAQAAPVQPKGTAVKRTWKFEVTDIKALFSAKPDLLVLTPNTAAINAIIKTNQSIPGLRIFEDVQTIVR